MRRFDDDERAELREAFIEAGEEYFLQYGPRKTTVADLTDEVGIAKGSFYTFFDSKSELFMEVVIQLGSDLVETVLTSVEDVEDGQEGIRLLFHTYVGWLEDHPFVQKLSGEVDQVHFWQGLPTDELVVAQREHYEGLATAVERWQTNGSLRDDVPPTTVVGLLELVSLLAVNTDEYDDAYYKMRDFSIETLARGLEP